MKLTIDQLDALSALKDRYHSSETVIIWEDSTLPLGYAAFVLEDSQDKMLITGGISSTGEVNT